MILTPEILKEARNKVGMSQSAVAKAIGVSQASYQYYESGERKPKHDKVIKLQQLFGLSETTNVVNEESETYLVKRRNLKNTQERKGVPITGGFTTLGNVVVYDDDNMKNEVIGQLPAHLFPGCNHGERASGDSMHPEIVNQAFVIGQIKDFQGITWGEKYIIKTKHGLDTVKYIHPGKSKKKILLKARNKSIPEQEVSVADITFLCQVKFIINPT